MTTYEEYRRALEQDGFVVCRNIIPAEVCEEARLELAAWHDRTEAACAERGFFPPSEFSHGIVKGFGSTQQPACWKLRCHAEVRRLFAACYGLDPALETDNSTQLLSSMDTHAWEASRSRSRQAFRKFGNEKERIATVDWTHSDQGIAHTRELCIQGSVPLLDMPSDGITFMAMRGSHKAHSRIFRNANKSDGDFLMLRKQHRHDGQLLSDQDISDLRTVFPPVRVSASVGDVVLWDSRVLHRNVTELNEDSWKPRAVFFVSMQPYFAPESAQALQRTGVRRKKHFLRRIDHYIKKRTASHNVYRERVDQVSPHFREKPETAMPEELVRGLLTPMPVPAPDMVKFLIAGPEFGKSVSF